MSDDAEKQLESSSENTSTATELLIEDAGAGRAAFVEQKKAEASLLKQGLRSGVSDEFGKPIIEEEPDAPQAATRSGDRSLDIGRRDRVAPELATDEQGRVTAFRLPDGRMIDIEYDSKGDPSSLTTGGKTFVKGKDGWHNVDNPTEKLAYVSVEKTGDKQGTVTMRAGSDDYVLGPDGSYKQKNWVIGKTVEEVEPDGTAKKYDLDTNPRSPTFREVLSTTTYKPDSAIAEVKGIDGMVDAYEVRDDHNHVTKVGVHFDGTGTITRGDKVEALSKVEQDPSGSLKLTTLDNSTIEVKEDGTWIRRNPTGKVTEITNSDGETTKFKRVGNKVTEATITDGQGNVRVTTKKGIESIDDKDGSYTVALDKDHKVKRLADGTEQSLDGKGKPTESRGDQLLSHFKKYTPEQQRQLRQDLADIDKLPPDQRERIYESLEKIAYNDEHPEQHMRLTGDQSRELVASLAHQIAHPGSIKQGMKGTCALASNEQVMARSHPVEYAEMVASLAIDGEYVTTSGRVLYAQGHWAGEHDPKSDAYAQRTYTSELFQNASAQLLVEPPKEYVSYEPWDPRIHPRPEGVTAATDSGERIIDPSKPDHPEPFVGTKIEAQARVLNELIDGANYKPSEPIENEEALKKVLEANGDKPLSVNVLINEQSRFLGMSPGDPAAASGLHSVTISHYEKGPPAMVYYENSAASTQDHSWPNGTGVPVEEFAKAMKSDKLTYRAVTNESSKKA